MLEEVWMHTVYPRCYIIVRDEIIIDEVFNERSRRDAIICIIWDVAILCANEDLIPLYTILSR